MKRPLIVLALANIVLPILATAFFWVADIIVGRVVFIPSPVLIAVVAIILVLNIYVWREAPKLRLLTGALIVLNFAAFAASSAFGIVPLAPHLPETLESKWRNYQLSKP